MKTAKEIHTIAYNTMMREMEKSKALAQEFLNGELTEAIEKAANYGEMKISLTVDKKLSLSIIIDSLKDNGYLVHQRGRILTISWELAF